MLNLFPRGIYKVMCWKFFDKDISEFSKALRTSQSTVKTADALSELSSYFNSTWRSSQKVKTASRGVPIPPPKKKGLHPRGSDVEKAEINFFFELGDYFENDYMPYRSDFQVKVEGVLPLEDGFVFLEDHWRVDSHIFQDDPPPREPHPYFHFQRGGHAQEDLAQGDNFVPGSSLDKVPGDWCALMQGPCPRIPFPPHCPILAIDFAIGQHNGDVWRRLRGTPEYREIVKKAQDRLWTPFFDGLANRDFREKWMGPVLLK
ncbi:hypothetical protein QC589_13525 [Halomonas elongata]|uniref:hypothetical protein n=1 Tax=Halomonas elongata TaxID=2746 RepID=UPI00335D29AE